MSTLWADRGSIPFTPNVTVFEPKQRAMLAWNGKEEILLLSTDLRASQPTKVLEVLPLPGEPEVSKGDTEVFRRATALINKKIRDGAISSLTRGAKSVEPAGEVTFHEIIGTHDISVVRVLNASGFVEWVSEYLKKDGVDNPNIPEVLKASVTEYTRGKFTWFVFDVVALDEKTKTNDAIQYRFKTDSLFYPLKISRTDKGDASIDLLILTPRLMQNMTGLGFDKIQVMHTPLTHLLQFEKCRC